MNFVTSSERFLQHVTKNFTTNKTISSQIYQPALINERFHVLPKFQPRSLRTLVKKLFFIKLHEPASSPKQTKIFEYLL